MNRLNNNCFIDSHAHLQSFNTRYLLNIDDPLLNWQEVWKIANINNVLYLLNIYDITDNAELQIMHEMIGVNNIFIALAVHPCHVNEISLIDAERILLDNINKIHCIGETGIDTYHDDSKLHQQLLFFEMHVKYANLYKKPISIHLRGELTDSILNKVIDILNINKEIVFVIHCCTYSFDQIQPFLIFPNCFISISGIVTYKNAIHIHELAKLIDINRLLIETDSPFLTPQISGINRSKTNNQSCYISHIYDKIAYIRNMNIEDLQYHVYNNFMKFLGIK